MPPKKKDFPCITCTVNVKDRDKGGSINCCVCERWCHIPCTKPLLEPAMVKWFYDMHKANGFHNWSCHNCMVAYHKMNVRICNLEKRIDRIDDKVQVNSAASAANSEKIDKVDKEVTAVKETVNKVRTEAVADATKAWSAELREREGRKTNLIIFGLQEPSLEVKSGPERKEKDETEVEAMLSGISANITIKEDVKYTTRLGAMGPTVATKPRPLKISFRTQTQREEVLSKAKNLPKTRFKKCSLTPDLTALQRTEDEELMKEAEQLNRNMSEEERLNWVYRCTGKKGERLITKLKIRENQQDRPFRRQDRSYNHQQDRPYNQHRTYNHQQGTAHIHHQDRTPTHQAPTTIRHMPLDQDQSDTTDMDSEGEEDSQTHSQKRTRGHSSDTSPRQHSQTDRQKRQKH